MNDKSGDWQRETNFITLFRVSAIAFGIASVFWCIWGVIWFYGLDAATVYEGTKKAEPIIHALEEYKRDKGGYPSSLSLLIPAYLEKIPQPAWSPKYEYRYYQCTDNSTGIQAFSLSFVPKGEAIGDGWHVYMSFKESWSKTDSDYMYFMYPCYADH